MMTESGTQDQIEGPGPSDALDTDWVPEFGDGPFRSVSFEAAETLAALMHQPADPYGLAYRAAFQLEAVMIRLNPAWVHFAQHGQVLSGRPAEVGL